MFKLLILEKLITKGNFIFLLVFFVLQCGFFVFSSFEGISGSGLNSLFQINCRFFYVFILVTLFTEKTSGFLAKQLSNGLSRSNIFYITQKKLIVLIILYYLLTTLSLYSISIYILREPTDFSRFIFSFLSFIVLSQLAYLFILFFNKNIFAVLIPYFLILGLDSFLFEWLIRYSNNQLFYFLPHSISMNFPMLYKGYNLNFVFISMTIFILVIPILSYFKLMKTNFND
jgi:hypothetical protein